MERRNQGHRNPSVTTCVLDFGFTSKHWCLRNKCGCIILWHDNATFPHPRSNLTVSWHWQNYREKFSVPCTYVALATIIWYAAAAADICSKLGVLIQSVLITPGSQVKTTTSIMKYREFSAYPRTNYILSIKFIENNIYMYSSKEV